MNDLIYRIRILLSSPGNLQADRAVVSEVVKAINLDSGQRDGFVAELVGWETHTRPSIGEYAQDVINKQLPKNIDIFLGIIGSRFGTPTRDWASGTEEEFRIAHANWKEHGVPDIMFYFSQKAMQPSSIDADQLNRIHAFKKDLEVNGVYYFEYEDILDFQLEIMRHLSTAIQDVISKKKSNENSTSEIAPPAPLSFYEELKAEVPAVAVNELIEEFVQEIENTSRVMDVLAENAERLTKRLNKHSKQLANYTKQGQPLKAIEVMGDATNTLASYKRKLKECLPELDFRMTSSMILLTRAAIIWENNDLREVMPMDEIAGALPSLARSISGTVDQIGALSNAFAELPQDVHADMSLQTRIAIALHSDLQDLLKKRVEQIKFLDEKLA